MQYVIHIKNFKQALNHGLALKKVHRIIKFKQKAWLYYTTKLFTENLLEKTEFWYDYIKPND